jgi:hypothetical protein
MTPGTTETGPVSLGAGPALAWPADAEERASASDTAAARRRTVATLAHPQKATL